MTQWPHVSVLLPEVVAALAPRDGEVFVDCTLGMGGHTQSLLEAADCRVYGIDRDPQALAIARERLARFGDRFCAMRGRFSEVTSLLAAEGVSQVDGVLVDLGVSSLQLDTPSRGFAFRLSGPIDMRMDAEHGLSAAQWLETCSEGELAEVLWRYGEEKQARRIARVIVEGKPWRDTTQLAEAIARVSPKQRPGQIHPATRSFQAIRIAVNDEMGELEALLEQIPELLRAQGRVAIIAFHSLEDRMVKQWLARGASRGVERDPWGHPVVAPIFRASSRPIQAGSDDPNPRARSARLRVAVRLP